MTKKAFPIEEVRRSIKRLMDEGGDLPKPLAAKLGLSETGIRDIFLEKTKSIGGPKLQVIARHYSVSVEDIMAGTATTRGVAPPYSANFVPQQITMPVSIPSVEALTEMFEALLDTVGVDPECDARAQRLARSFPSAFQAAALPPAGRGSLKQKILGALPQSDGPDRVST